MDLPELEAFLVLCQELHFGRTAERLQVSQPRVSRLIAMLESTIGCVLFERTSGGSRSPRSARACATRWRPPTSG